MVLRSQRHVLIFCTLYAVISLALFTSVSSGYRLNDLARSFRRARNGTRPRRPNAAAAGGVCRGRVVVRTLCDSPNVSLTVGAGDQCANNFFGPTTMAACCRGHAEARDDPCELPLSPFAQRCRAVSLDRATNETCCDRCSCYGDPHCESFSGVGDTWVLCDGRTPQEDGNCPMTRERCVSQLDENGLNCTFLTNPDGSPWVVGIQGSPCRANEPGENGELPTMLMYAADNFSVVLTMGERSIIENVIINEGNNTYVMSASLCFEDGTTGFPWRDSLNASIPPPTSPSWPPHSWNVIELPGGDILWDVKLDSGIEVDIRCTRTRFRNNNGVVTSESEPRLNLEQLVEPDNWRPGTPNRRVDPTGFCVDDQIAKLGTTSNTDFINANGLCEANANDLEVAKIICGNATTAPGVPGCKNIWCNEVRPNDFRQCVVDFQNFRWSTLWCAANTVPSQQPEDCRRGQANFRCRQCLRDIEDFGWEAAIQSWSGTLTSDVECSAASDLPEDLVGCQAGVRIQYMPAPNIWITYRAVPSTTVVCGAGLTFSSSDDAPMFQFPIRVQQCSLPPDCPEDLCTAQSGFTASFRYSATPSQSESIIDAWNNEQLICDPALFPGLSDPQDCLDLSPPTGMCPCPSSN